MTLDHDAVRKAYPSITLLDDSFVDYGLDSSGIKVSIVQSKVDEARASLNSEALAIAYQGKRKKEYPSIEDQLDDIYHNGIDGWKATIKTTKDKYPKPS